MTASKSAQAHEYGCVIMFFDEPSLSQIALRPDRGDDAVDWLASMESVEGFHCLLLRQHRWGMVLRTGLDILSFDAYNYSAIWHFTDDRRRSWIEEERSPGNGSQQGRTWKTVRSLCAETGESDGLRARALTNSRWPEVPAHSAVRSRGLSPGRWTAYRLLSGVSREMKRYGFDNRLAGRAVSGRAPYLN